jgi:uncharacterized protein with PQ loop repeat
VRRVLALVMTILGFIVSFVIFFGTIFYLIHYVGNAANPAQYTLSDTPVGIAGVIATIGGLVLVGAFYKAENQLKNVGKLLLTSASLFVISFFAMQYISLVKDTVLTGVDWFFIWSFDIAFLLDGISLAVGLGYLMAIIPSI